MAHITRSKRDQLEALKRAGHTQQEMAAIIGCHQTTIGREMIRNGSLKQRRYKAQSAQKRSTERRNHSYDDRIRWHDDHSLLLHVEAELIDGKSPDQIAGRMLEQGRKHVVSHQSIYTYVERNKERGGNLHKFLRYQGKKYKWRGTGGDGRGQIPNRKGIEERPDIVNEKGRSGDWESDLVVSPKDCQGAAATFVERTCMYFRAILVVDRSANEMVRATDDALGDIPEAFRLTMTHDNGKEISKHEQITANLNMTVYCARTYKSCDRGLNEFMNRELRRFFPQGTDFSEKTQVDIDAAVEWLNNCPRRSLNYRTPKEMFQEKLEIMRFTL
jgi:transposase, IS30 family